VLDHQEDQALLKSYISEWRKFFEQCDYLPPPFRQLETSLCGKTNPSKKNGEDTIVRKVKKIKGLTVLNKTVIYHCGSDNNDYVTFLH
jgi:hypothetical protein